MSKLAFEVTKVIQENIATILTFAYSRVALTKFLAGHFTGRWPFLSEAAFDIPSQRATRAVIETVVLFRSVDDSESISDDWSGISFGELIMRDRSIHPLDLRNVANKIVHAESLVWDFEDPQRPILVATAHANAKEKWLEAKIDINGFVAVCGTFMK